MAKVLAVFGATGRQGSAVIHYVLNDPELSQKYKIRAITRDVHSEKAMQLKGKAEIVQGDMLNRTSIETVLTGANTVFAMTTPSLGPDSLEIEYNSGKTIADVAVEKRATYIIFSTLPPVREISSGKYTRVTSFDAKAKVEEHIRGLPIESAFYSPGSFMENFQAQTCLAPRQGSDGTWVMTCNASPKTQMPLLNAVADTGKFVGAILAEPNKYEGTTFYAATALYSLEEMCIILSKATGKPIVYKQIPHEDFKKSLPFMADFFVEYFSYLQEFGYFGPDSDNMVAWAARNARGRLTTFEEYLEAHPFQLT